MTSNPDLQDAIARFESYLQADPANALLWVEVGDLYHRSGRFDEAIACFEKALMATPGLAPARSRIASVLISLHRFSEAETLLRQLVEEGDHAPALLHNLGLTLYFQRRWGEAQECFQAAESGGLHAPGNLRYLAQSLHHQGEMEHAIATCEEWVKLSNSAQSKGFLAVLEMDNGNMGAASQLAREVLAQDPDNTDAEVVVGTAAIENQDIAEALQHFDHVVRIEPDNGRGWLGLGLAHLHEQQHDQAITELQTATELMPSSAGTIVALGWAKLTQKDVLGAEKVFRNALEVDRNFSESHGGLAVTLVMLGKEAEAREEARIATRLDPHSFGAAYARALMLKMGGKGEIATEMIARILEQPPQPGAKPLIEYLRIGLAKRDAQRLPDQDP
jgi:tetratricopeptide (TPR) repeat protein